ncbi:methyltransferase type 12 [Halorhodospira halochloris]|uniref:Methyltransferase type 12 n=1 Tax=Halorhodospira halochloris TaxID=1052 RepID=A0A110B5R6_HALHR|nr:class I SAM-dependent methyltransferase [Halorhodospira halochloris]BAU57987.1 methyltransferase type 12 [Halorhodospira halochloris]
MRIRAWLYDKFLLGLTGGWYAEVIERLPDGVKLLDVGIGTAGALLANGERVAAKDLHITGIDIDSDYIACARERLRGSGLEDRIDLRLESIYDHQGGPYAAVYFSASFMILPEPEKALRHCMDLLSEGGRIFFTQTIQNKPSRWLERFKPLLGRLTSIEFGRVTYEQEFRNQIQAAGLELETFTALDTRGTQSYCLAVARPKTG